MQVTSSQTMSHDATPGLIRHQCKKITRGLCVTLLLQELLPDNSEWIKEVEGDRRRRGGERREVFKSSSCY